MRRCPAIGIHNDLAPGKAGIAVRTANDKGPGRIDVSGAIARHRQIAQGFQDKGFDNRADLFAVPAGIKVLGRKHNRGHLRRLAVLIANCNLAF